MACSFILWAPTQEHLVPVRDRGRQRRENRADTNSTHPLRGPWSQWRSGNIRLSRHSSCCRAERERERDTEGGRKESLCSRQKRSFSRWSLFTSSAAGSTRRIIQAFLPGRLQQQLWDLISLFTFFFFFISSLFFTS